MRKRIGKIGVLLVFGMLVLIGLSPSAIADGQAIVDGGNNNSEEISIGTTSDDYDVFFIRNDVEMMRLDDGVVVFNENLGNIDFRIEGDNDANLFFGDAGNDRIGIGTTSPQSKLSVAGGASIGTTYAISYAASAGDLLVENNVGIGVYDPAEKLEVDGNILLNTGADRTIDVEQPLGNHDGYKLTVSAGDANYLSDVLGFAGGDLVLHAGDGAGPGIEMVPSPGGDVYIYGGDAFMGYDGDVILAHTGTSSRGKVGIGTDSPVSTLDVAGRLTVDYSIRSSSIYGLNLHDGIQIFNDETVLIGIAHGLDTPDTPLEISANGIEKSNIDILTISNYVYGEDNDGTSSSIVFNQWYRKWPYYEVGVEDAGRISVGLECDWTNNPDFHDSYMAFQTSLAGTVDEKVRITSEGRVGIGTTSPGALLELSKNSGDPDLRFDIGGTDKFTIGVDDSDGDKFKIGTTSIDTNTRLTIDSSGNVGIGTTTPARALHISDVMRLEPRSSAPSSPSQGDIYMHDGTGTPNYPVLRVYDGTQWQDLW